MKNTEYISDLTGLRKGIVRLYYSVQEDKVFSRPGENRWYITTLLTPHTPEEVENTVKSWLAL